MRRLTVYALPALAVCCLAGVMAARAEEKWLQTEYDFGVMMEADGPKAGEVKMVNLGPGPTMITRVRPSCGCTDATFTDRILEPGDTATVTFTYSPAGRPGKFMKTIRVFTGADEQQKLIKIRGSVVGTDETLSRHFPVKAGALRLSDTGLDAGKLAHGTARHLFLTLCNQSADSLRVSLSNASPALSAGVNPETIGPGDIATLGVYVNTADEPQMGPVEYPVGVTTSTGDSITVTVAAEIVPDTASLTPEQVDNGPRAYVKPELVDFGTPKRKTHTFSFRIANEGRSEMNVTRVYSRCPEVEIKRFPMSLRPGKEGKVEGVLKLDNRQPGPFRIDVEVATDDPLHPVRTVALVGDIK